MIFNFDVNKIRDFEKREFLLSLGNGSYAMNNILLIPSRRYHSLYNYSKKPPVERSSYFHNVEETVSINGKYYNLFSRRLSQSSVFPQGYRYIKKILIKRNDITWFYKVEDVLIVKRLYSQNNILRLSYNMRNKNNHNVTLFIRPFFEDRNSDSLEQCECNLKISGDNIKNNIMIFRPDNRVVFEKDYAKADFFLLNEWDYKMDKYSIQVISPGFFKADFHENDNIEFEIFPEEKRQVVFIEHKKIHNHAVNNLIEFSKDFIVNKENNLYIMAGYPWFGPWGRDTFISISGLVIYTGLYREAENIIDSFCKNIKDGIIPNLISEDGECLYNTVDGSLWFINALWELYNQTRERCYIDKYYEIISLILFNYRKGTVHNIYMDKEDYLLCAGDKDTQLTWMDAQRDGITFTPRYGKAVEINALWYNAIKIFEYFSKISGFSQNAVKAFELGEKIKKSFNRTFWSDTDNYLYDCIHTEKDNSLRPNQLFSISLPFAVMTDTDKINSIVDVCSKRLYTENGIRTLSCDSKDYKGNYSGNWFERDSCYHQGTAWPYLLGTYFESYLISRGFSAESKNYVRQSLIDFIVRNHKKNGCGFISEIFDGSGPQLPHGAPMQAWSSAELIRIWMKYYN